MQKIILSLFLSLILFSCSQDSNPKAVKEVRISSISEPTTLDPRLGFDMQTAVILNMLYEGLMRMSDGGKITPGLAEKVSTSVDGKTYTFELRDSTWSDGSPITAYDIEETWKSTLSPNFPSPNAYQLYVIKGAKNYKNGTGSEEQLGFKATTPYTFVVELEEPTPYFLNLVATYFFSPVHSTLREGKDDLQPTKETKLVTNGPFKLIHWKHNNEVVVEKNPFYWDSKHVKLDKISTIIIQENTALQMFEANELDWVGSPMSTIPQDTVATLKKQGRLQIKPAAGTYWFYVNTEKNPFKSLLLRRAFNLAINRHDIVTHVTQGNQHAAFGIVPTSLGLRSPPYFEDNNITQAWSLFQEALEELDLDKDNFPKIKMIYATNDRNHKIAQAIQQQWQKAFGIDIGIESLETKMYYERLKKQDYQLALGSWFADFNDPINFLDIFKSKENPSNRTGWEDSNYAKLLDASALEQIPEKRKGILRQAEALLMEHVPVIPIFFAAYNYVKSDDLKGVYFSELGFLDFKSAFFDFPVIDHLDNE